MIHLATSDLVRLLTTYGYGAVLVFVVIESIGIPFPGETMLLVAAVFAGTTHHIAIPLVILAAASGAILGDNLGFWIGREGGFRLLRRYGHFIHLDERKLRVGLYLFRKHGGKVSSLAALSPCYVPGQRSWLEPTVCAGRPSYSIMPLGVSPGPRSTVWGLFPGQ